MNTFSKALFDQMPIVGIMRNVPVEHIPTIAEIYANAGLTSLEVTMNSVGAEATIASLVKTFAGRLNIGAGTVCSTDDLGRALNAGAGFIVAPIINEEVIKKCVAESIPIFPGATTPSEIYKAWSLGARLIKLFPAGDLTPAKVKEILAPLDFVHLMPTGGVNLENFTDFFRAGIKAVGMGNHLFPRDIIDNEDWATLDGIYRSFVSKYQTFTKEVGEYKLVNRA